MKARTIRSVRAAASVLGYSERQRQHWWVTYMVGGLDALLTRSPRLDRQERVSAEAWCRRRWCPLGTRLL
jgi:hypothetical protein